MLDEDSSIQKYLVYFEGILGRKTTGDHVKDIAVNCNSDHEFIWKLLLSNEGLDVTCRNAPALHLYFIHSARLKAIRTLIPPGKVILDLGGAANPLYYLGYPHPFKQLFLIDLPMDQRFDDYKEVNLEYEGEGKVTIHYSNMIDLSSFPDGIADLVWSGQSIEHIHEEEGEIMCSEAYRVLKKGGFFCLDTPNRKITSIHTGRPEGMINPDHKIEYTPEELRFMVIKQGFSIVCEKGICEMPKTSATGQFSYEDFILGSSISNNIDDSYIAFLVCQK
jgi:SAM-dependent methyltransferase